MTAKRLAAEIWRDYEEQVTSLLRNDANAIRMFRWNAWWCVENLFKMESPSEREFDGIEHELNHVLFEEHGTPVLIKGFIDRWHMEGDEIVVGDYKTGKVPGVAYRQDKFYQLLIYAHVLREQLKANIKEVQLLYVKNSELLSMKPTEQDFDDVMEDIISTRAAIDSRCVSGHFEPRVSRLCDWCSFKPICPAWKKG